MSTSELYTNLHTLSRHESLTISTRLRHSIASSTRPRHSTRATPPSSMRSTRMSMPSTAAKSSMRVVKSAAPRSSTRNTSSRSEEHTSELHSLIHIPYAHFTLKKKPTRMQLRYNVNSNISH